MASITQGTEGQSCVHSNHGNRKKKKPQTEETNPPCAQTHVQSLHTYIHIYGSTHIYQIWHVINKIMAHTKGNRRYAQRHRLCAAPVALDHRQVFYIRFFFFLLLFLIPFQTYIKHTNPL